MNPKTYQDEIVDPVIRKICDKMDSGQYSSAVENNVTLINTMFGETKATVYVEEEMLIVVLDDVSYTLNNELNEVSYDILQTSHDKVLRYLKLHEKKRDKAKLKNAVKNILEDGIKKPYVQRF